MVFNFSHFSPMDESSLSMERVKVEYPVVGVVSYCFVVT